MTAAVGVSLWYTTTEKEKEVGGGILEIVGLSGAVYNKDTSLLSTYL